MKTSMEFLLNLTIASSYISGGNKTDINKCVSNIIDDYFKKPEILFIALNQPEFNIPTNKTIILMNQDYKQPDKSFTRYRIFPIKIDQIVIYIHNVSNIENEIELWQLNAQWYGNAYIVLIFPSKGDEIQVKTTLKKMWQLTNAWNTFLLVDFINYINIYTLSAYTTNCVGNIELVDSYVNNSFVKLIQLFPKKLPEKYNQCTIVVITATSPPYVLAPNENGNISQGLETEIFLSIIEFLNIRYSYITPKPGDSPYITSDANGNPFGLFAKIANRKADVAFYGLRLKFDTYYNSEVVLPMYIEDEFVWAVPEPRKIPHWKNIFLVFKSKLWLLVGVSCILTILTNYLIRHDPFTFTLTLTLAIFFNTSVPHTQSNLFKFFLTIVLFFVFIITNSFTSGILQFLTDDIYEKPIETAFEATQRGLKPIIYPTVLQDLYDSPSEYREFIDFIETHKDKVEISADIFDIIRRTAMERNTVIVILKSNAVYEGKLKYTTASGVEKIRFLPKRFKPYTPLFFMSKNHPLKNIFSRKITQIVESGLVKIWLSKIIHHLNFERKYCSLVEDSEVFNQILSIEKLLGSFILYCAGICTAIMVFFAEILYNKKIAL